MVRSPPDATGAWVAAGIDVGAYGLPNPGAGLVEPNDGAGLVDPNDAAELVEPANPPTVEGGPKLPPVDDAKPPLAAFPKLPDAAAWPWVAGEGRCWLGKVGVAPSGTRNTIEHWGHRALPPIELAGNRNWL